MIRFLATLVLIVVCISIPSCLLVQHTKAEIIKHLTIDCIKVKGQCVTT